MWMKGKMAGRARAHPLANMAFTYVGISYNKITFRAVSFSFQSAYHRLMFRFRPTRFRQLVISTGPETISIIATV